MSPGLTASQPKHVPKSSSFKSEMFSNSYDSIENEQDDKKQFANETRLLLNDNQSQIVLEKLRNNIERKKFPRSEKRKKLLGQHPGCFKSKNLQLLQSMQFASSDSDEEVIIEETPRDIV